MERFANVLDFQLLRRPVSELLQQAILKTLEGRVYEGDVRGVGSAVAHHDDHVEGDRTASLSPLEEWKDIIVDKCLDGLKKLSPVRRRDGCVHDERYSISIFIILHMSYPFSCLFIDTTNYETPLLPLFPLLLEL